MGMIYKRGKMFWIKYYCGGKPIRESTDTKKQKEAERFLKDREGRVAIGVPALPRLERIRFGEAADALTEHYRVTGSRQLKDVQSKLKPVRAFFEHYRLVGIDHASIITYMSQRQAVGLSNATINRELSSGEGVAAGSGARPTPADAAHSSLARICTAIRLFRASRLRARPQTPGQTARSASRHFSIECVWLADAVRSLADATEPDRSGRGDVAARTRDDEESRGANCLSPA